MPQPNSSTTRLKLRGTSFYPCMRGGTIVAIAFFTLAVVSLHAQQRVALRKVFPAYPPIAKQMGITGTVIVAATVDASGRVIKAESTSGNKLLAAPAIEAVKQWRFAAGDGTQTFPVAVNFEKASANPSPAHF